MKESHGHSVKTKRMHMFVQEGRDLEAGREILEDRE